MKFSPARRLPSKSTTALSPLRPARPSCPRPTDNRTKTPDGGSLTAAGLAVGQLLDEDQDPVQHRVHETPLLARRPGPGHYVEMTFRHRSAKLSQNDFFLWRSLCGGRTVTSPSTCWPLPDTDAQKKNVRPWAGAACSGAASFPDTFSGCTLRTRSPDTHCHRFLSPAMHKRKRTYELQAPFHRPQRCAPFASDKRGQRSHPRRKAATVATTRLWQPLWQPLGLIDGSCFHAHPCSLVAYL